MKDRNTGEKIVSDLGLDPAIDVDSDQRAELLQRWHKEEPPDDGKHHEPNVKRDLEGD